MDKPLNTLTPSKIVLVADAIDEPDSQSLELRRDLEKSEQKTINRLIEAIRSLGREVVHYQSPSDLAKNASQHKMDIVLSIYGGEKSRNRMALVPAICETFGLKFIGPDVYGRIIAQDKEVSKRLAIDCGLRTPKWYVLRRLEDVGFFQKIEFPCVVKPLLEGSSIGISQSNLTYSVEQAEKLARRLFIELAQPILVEQFIPGRETALSVIEHRGKIQSAYSEIIIENDLEYFKNNLFDVDEKRNPAPGRTVRNIDGELRPSDRKSIETFLKSFGQFGYCRVDGRHMNGKFYFLELTPDAWLDPCGQFAMAFTKRDWSYSQVISALLASKD